MTAPKLRFQSVGSQVCKCNGLVCVYVCVCVAVCSGPSCEPPGADCEALGQEPEHQRRDDGHHLQLLPGSPAYPLPTVCVTTTANANNSGS